MRIKDLQGRVTACHYCGGLVKQPEVGRHRKYCCDNHKTAFNRLTETEKVSRYRILRNMARNGK
jgi:hypothetical protein